MRTEAFFIFSRGAYTIFLSGEAENATFAIGRREQKWHIQPARQKNAIFIVFFSQKIFGLSLQNHYQASIKL